MTKAKMGCLIVALFGLGALAGGVCWWQTRQQQTPDATLVLYGNVDIRQVNLAFNGSEHIASVLVQEGYRVSKGQLLATLDTHRLDPVVARAEAQVQAQRGVTVLVTTHFMAEAEYCDRLAIMAAGEILALGPPAEIRKRARSPARPSPTLEEAFISLIEPRTQGGGAS